MLNRRLGLILLALAAGTPAWVLGQDGEQPKRCFASLPAVDKDNKEKRLFATPFGRRFIAPPPPPRRILREGRISSFGKTRTRATAAA